MKASIPLLAAAALLTGCVIGDYAILAPVSRMAPSATPVAMPIAGNPEDSPKNTPYPASPIPSHSVNPTTSVAPQENRSGGQNAASNPVSRIPASTDWFTVFHSSLFQPIPGKDGEVALAAETKSGKLVIFQSITINSWSGFSIDSFGIGLREADGNIYSDGPSRVGSIRAWSTRRKLVRDGVVIDSVAVFCERNGKIFALTYEYEFGDTESSIIAIVAADIIDSLIWK